jgi:uncharacterized DUF497 family protein
MNVFAWDIPKAIANFEKHGVPFKKEATVFGGPNGSDGGDAARTTCEYLRRRIRQSVTGRI